jgi:hypothetical protein
MRVGKERLSWNLERSEVMKRAVIISIIVAALGVGGFAAVQLYANNLVRNSLDQYIEEMGPEASINYGQVRYDLFRRRAYIRDIRINSSAAAGRGADELNIGELAVLEYDLENRIPYRFHARASEMTIPLDFEEQALADLEAMGFARQDVEQLHMTSEMSYGYAGENRELTLEKYKLDIRGWMAFSAAVTLAEIDLEKLAALAGKDPEKSSPLALLAVLGKVQLVSASLDMEVATLAERLIEGVARKEGVEAELFREETALAAERKMAQDPGMPPELASFITEFIRRPGNVRMGISPAEPVSAIELFTLSESGGAIMERLGVDLVKY